jgi:SAM-dependent methyltransferase
LAELQHPHSRSFELVADLYEHSRPEYPPEAIEWIAHALDLRAGRTVLDLGAGTGKLTRALVPTAAHVIAVEPGEQMLAQLRAVLPDVEAIRGGAEAIPLDDGSVDAITVGQAFHWFRHDEALPELHRVLRAAGGLALLWNNRDQDAPLQREVSDLIAPLAVGRAAAWDSSRYVRESELFGAVEHRTFRFTQELIEDELVGRIASISFVAAAPAATRAEIEARLREIAAAHGGRVDFPYVTDVYVSFTV